MNISFVDFAKVELDEAAAYYDNQRSGLGDEFRDEVRRVTDRILEDPTSLPKYTQNSRMCRTHRFPYGIIYQIRQDQIRIVAVMHLHRDSDYWKDRLEG